MKRLLVLLSALSFALPCLGDGDGQIVKDGWNVGPLPCVSYNSDLGFQYGLCADIFNYKGVFPDYRQRYYLEASRYTKGQTLLHAQFDSKYLIPGIRTTFSASYQYDPMFLFYGLDGLEAYDPSMDANKETRTARYAYRRSMLRILADFQAPLGDNLWAVAGASFWKYRLGDIAMEAYDAQNTLFHWMREAGVFKGGEADGGSRLEVKGGLVLDTRENESAPSQGIWAEAYLNASPDLFSDGFGYVRLAAHWRQYIPLAGDRLVLAYHLAWQGTLLGEAPFYTQQNISTLFLRQTCTDGLGGINTVRGLLAQRLVGRDYAWMNTELRLKLFSFNLLDQSWYVALNPFIDGGMVTSLYKGEELASFYGRTVDELKEDAVKPHFSAGSGLKLAMNRNFIVSVELARPFKATDGGVATYIALNYIF